MIVNLSKDSSGINFSLLRVSGVDAQDFLHKQFSNDILNLVQGQAQINAYCSHKGRVIALFRVFLLKDVHYLMLPTDLAEKTIKRLKMFVLNAKVVIEEAQELLILGFLDEPVTQDLGHNITYNTRQSLAIIPNNQDISSLNIAPQQFWLQASIEQNQPEVTLATSEVFVPQMLNLDLNEVNGVNFQKGCYPGQEIVARLHYLGKAKRRLVQLHSTDNTLKIGDKLLIKKSESLKESGRIVLVATNNDTTSIICLATIEVALKLEKIQTESGAKLTLLEQ